MFRLLIRLLLVLSGATLLLAAPERATLDLSGSGWQLWFDRDATWRDDPLYFPTPPLDTLPVHEPTGGWNRLSGGDTKPVSVPGTVEEYLQQKAGPEGDLTGVSWWWRDVAIPPATGPRTVLLRFESIRLRAEVFVNRRLAAYDVVGNSPLEIDISRFVTPGERCQIAVRVTDPAGNFDWRDSQPMRWGKYALPVSHGFGGITGRVQLVVCDPIHVADIYVQNTPTPTTVNALVTIRNDQPATQERTLHLAVLPRGGATGPVFESTPAKVTLPPGETVLPITVSVPNAALWDPEHPHLYECRVALSEGNRVTDEDVQTFGFRWFALDRLGRDAVLRLNGRRVVLRTAISWGFWPVNGIFPTKELAAKQIRVAKELGLNMLNFHRAIGNPIVLEQADELGLMYFEEPGGHKSGDRDPFAQQLAREKLLRMVRRDRSHPSLVIYNLINEWDSRNPHPDPKEIALHQDDMAAAHALDPSRLIVHTSAWARGPEIDDPAKLHFRPFDSEPHLTGWYDVHHAGGPATWNESLYRSPTDFYGLTENTKEIVYWGEEGALSTPPRLALIKRSLDTAPTLGWDGAMYLDWYHQFDAFLTQKELRRAFADVDAFTRALGAVSLGHQGRRIENMRMSNVGDGYAINGWESEIVENHSGIVDCFRNPKADPAILAYYNQPLYVAVKVRNTVLQAPAKTIVDCFAVNERDLRGPHVLQVSVRDQGGRTLAQTQKPVVLTGGDTFGELLAAGLELPIPAGVEGLLTVAATLHDPTGKEQARGHDELLALDWRGDSIRGRGAVWESEDRLQRYLHAVKGADVPAMSSGLKDRDWIAVARGPAEGEPTRIPAARFGATDASSPGLEVTFYRDPEWREKVLERHEPTVAYSVDDGAAPDPALGVMTNYGVRWRGRVTTSLSGKHTFVLRSTGQARLLIDGHVVVETSSPKGPATGRGSVDLVANHPADVVIELKQGRGVAQTDLSWITPEPEGNLSAVILERVRQGATLVVLERAESWMPLITGATNPSVQYKGAFTVGKTWLGGVHFVRDHPLFAGLPVNTAMDWPYQAIVRNGEDRSGLQLEGEDLAAGCYHSYPMHLGTAVGVIRYGQGRVIFSTLDLCGNLDADTGPSIVARKLIDNFLNYAAVK